MSGKLNLLGDSSDEESNSELTINKNYANRYDVFRNREELRKLKELSKDVSDTSESEEEVEPKIEKEFLKALSLLKGKDPTIYDENFSLFKEEDPVERKPKAKKEKPMFMKDYERKVILECNGELSGEEGEENSAPKGPNYYEEMEEIKKGFNVQDSEDDSGDDLLKEGTKTKEQLAEEEEDYKKWLESEPDMHHLQKSWKDPNISKEDKFLRDYLLNKEFLVNDETGGIAACAQLTGDMDANILQDEEDLDEQAEFEQKYQHRFEEPDEEFIKQYPRTVGDSLRRVDNKRKVKRQEHAERKAREKAQKEEELKRLKALKRKEIEEKFLKLKEVSGQEVLNFDEEDIESDFDPDKHDRKMKELFDEDYYANAEEQKPEFPYDEELDEENWDGWTREQTENTAEDGIKEEYDCNDEIKEDYDYNEAEMDESEKLDWKAQFEADMIESTAGKKKKRKKSLFAEIVARDKPLYDPDGKSFEEYLDEYYRLDYEDVIGDQPVRFRYRKVVPNDFGLSIDEILAANDKELNKWCSVKKAYQYRQDDEEMYEVQAFKRKAQNQRLKEMTLTSVYSKPEETKEEHGIDNKSKKKRKKKFNRSAAKDLNDTALNSENKIIKEETMEQDSAFEEKNEITSNFVGDEFIEENREGLSKKRKGKRAKNASEEESKRISPLKKLKKHGSFSEENTEIASTHVEDKFIQEEGRQSKKKKSKHGIVSEEKQEISTFVEDQFISEEDRQSKKKKSKHENAFEEESGRIRPLKKHKKKHGKFPEDKIETASTFVEENFANDEYRLPKKKSKHGSVSEENHEITCAFAEEKFISEEDGQSKKKKSKHENAFEEESDRIRPLKKHKKKNGSFSEEKNETASTLVEDNFIEDEDRLSKKKKSKHARISEEKHDITSTLVEDKFISKEDKQSKKKKSKHKNASEESALKKTHNKNSDFEENVVKEPILCDDNPHDSKNGKFKSKKNKNRVPAIEKITDRRLALSDERLAAFGINPKKFKNSVKYSKS